MSSWIVAFNAVDCRAAMPFLSRRRSPSARMHYKDPYEVAHQIDGDPMAVARVDSRLVLLGGRRLRAREPTPALNEPDFGLIFGLGLCSGLYESETAGKLSCCLLL